MGCSLQIFHACNYITRDELKPLGALSVWTHFSFFYCRNMADSKDEVVGLDIEASGPIVLKSSDEKTFTLEKKSAFISKLVSQALENGLAFPLSPLTIFCRC